MRRKSKQSWSWGYPLKVWLWTVVASPAVFMLALALVRGATAHELYKSIKILVLLLFFGFFLLLPLLLLYWLVFRLLRFRPLSHRVKWLLLSATGIGVIWVLCYFYDQRFFAEGGFGVYAWPLSYSGVLAVAGALLKGLEGYKKRPVEKKGI